MLELIQMPLEADERLTNRLGRAHVGEGICNRVVVLESQERHQLVFVQFFDTDTDVVSRSSSRGGHRVHLLQDGVAQHAAQAIVLQDLGNLKQYDKSRGYIVAFVRSAVIEVEPAPTVPA
jgi:hypothetical protein